MEVINEKQKSLEILKLEPDDNRLIVAVLIGYFVLTCLKLVDLDLDIFDKRTAVVEAQMLEAHYWLRRFEHVRKLMNATEQDQYACACDLPWVQNDPTDNRQNMVL